MSNPNGKGNDENGKENEMITSSEIIKSVGIVAAAVGFAAWGICKIMGSSVDENNKKLMKKPGADGYMNREDFEKNPKDYFRDLHGKK
ncbi:hypothetical protein FXO38_12366 [Capsicum annuum]|uniref:Uncharacterized protein n=1 Tax=Capsicum annuum TaxID=4072 RepID=A0A2G2YCY4_CAPAN|nr:hypothetical protein FXO37_18620 [Capsicum annuum]KAF3659961.1 hypothetical protein FXO38_12366 [Capsicum annuum]PHT67608.1 hypothetical protein T459_27095 [Capsicum annuum]